MLTDFHIAFTALCVACGAPAPHAPFTPTITPERDDWGGAFALHGDLLAIGGQGVASVEVYRRHESTWLHEAQLRPPNTAGRFGSALAISFDPVDHICIGAPEQEVVYVFAKGPDGWAQRGDPLRLPSSPTRTWFGHSVAIVGQRLVVGAPLFGVGDDHDGAAFVFRMRPQHGPDLPIYESPAVSRIDPPRDAAASEFGREIQGVMLRPAFAGQAPLFETAIGAMWSRNQAHVFVYDEAWTLKSRISWPTEQSLFWFEFSEDQIAATVRLPPRSGVLQIWRPNAQRSAWTHQQTLQASTGANLFGSIAHSGTHMVVRGEDATPPCLRFASTDDRLGSCPPRHPETSGLFFFEESQGNWHQSAHQNIAIDHWPLTRNMTANADYFVFRQPAPRSEVSSIASTLAKARQFLGCLALSELFVGQ